MWEALWDCSCKCTVRQQPAEVSYSLLGLINDAICNSYVDKRQYTKNTSFSLAFPCCLGLLTNRPCRINTMCLDINWNSLWYCIVTHKEYNIIFLKYSEEFLKWFSLDKFIRIKIQLILCFSCSFAEKNVKIQFIILV